jgi:hypothetical protein
MLQDRAGLPDHWPVELHALSWLQLTRCIDGMRG